MRTKVCVTGAGPAGLMAAIFAADLLSPAEAGYAKAWADSSTTVIEANTSAGRKLLLTGAGRCNLTHQAKPDEVVREFGDKGKFLSYCLHQFSPRYIQDFFTGLGLRLKIEKDGCVFPASDRASDVRDVLVNRAKKLGVRFLYGKRVSGIDRQESAFVVRTAKETVYAEKLIIATGGLSWPKTGSTGNGYKFAKRFGHTIVELRASLVPLVTCEDWPGQLAGTAMEDVSVSARINNKKIKTAGATIFTDDGIGGPSLLDMSRHLARYLQAGREPIGPQWDTPRGILISLDLAPRVSEAELEKEFTERLDANPKKKVVNVLSEFVPKRVSAVLCGQTGCADELVAGQLTRDVRKKLLRLIKTLPISVVGTRPIDEATVTSGGVSIGEIEPKTMESKICPGLFFAGEIIDADGPCGGYNLQMCWSTGALAGSSAAKKTKERTQETEYRRQETGES